MLANPFVLIVTLIAGLVAAFIYLWNTNEDFKNACIKIWNAIVEAFETVVDALKTFVTETVPNLFNALVDWFAALPEKFIEIGSNIIEGIWSGISSGWSWLVDNVKSLANSLFGAAQDELDIHSPSRKFKWLGEMCTAGWEEGTEDLMDPEIMENNIKASFSVAKSNVSTTASAGGSGPQVVDNNVHVYLEGDAKGIFKVVRCENNNAIRTTGMNPLLGY
jgi:phage-related protein